MENNKCQDCRIIEMQLSSCLKWKEMFKEGHIYKVFDCLHSFHSFHLDCYNQMRSSWSYSCPECGSSRGIAENYAIMNGHPTKIHYSDWDVIKCDCDCEDDKSDEESDEEK